MISPWTRGGGVDHTVYEHTSIIRFISDNWGLPYLTRRHASTNSIESAFGGFTRFDPNPVFTPYEAPLELVLEPTLEQAGIRTPRITVKVDGSDLHRLVDTGFADRLPIRLDWRFEDSFAKSRPALLEDATRLLSR